MRGRNRTEEREEREDETNTHTHTQTHTKREKQRERERERERKKEKKNDCSKIRLGATILTGKSKSFTKNDRSKASNKKTKTERMERRIAAKRQQLPFLSIPKHTHTGI